MTLSKYFCVFKCLFGVLCYVIFNVLQNLYNVLITPQFSYCILCWGSGLFMFYVAISKFFYKLMHNDLPLYFSANGV